MSKKYSLNIEDGLSILKVFGWVVASAVVAFTIDLIPSIEIGANYAWLVPMINTALVALKKFIQEKID
jgi:hypothetical protein